MKSEPGPPMTLGNAAAAKVRLIVWCKSCQHQVEPDPADRAAVIFTPHDQPIVSGRIAQVSNSPAAGTKIDFRIISSIITEHHVIPDARVEL
jgi:hypothetical protein